jgi:phenol 2-monooxygenase
MDTLAVTDFPDIRTKCAIQSVNGSILHIPREGGYLFRMYVDLGEVPPNDNGAVRTTTVEAAIARANEILHPYTLDVKDVAWYSVYEVGHRLTDKFDDVPAGDNRTPRVFIAGDACHTHSAKAGQGMNVSIQDGFNLGWKLAHVLLGRSPVSLLETYSAERQVIAKNLIDFDKQWSSLMAAKPEDFQDPTELGDFYVRTAEFPAGFMTQYPESMLIGDLAHQSLATGFPVGKRFKSAPVVRVADGNHVHLGHHHRADGRWRLYAFADAGATGAASALTSWADWLTTSPESPVVAYTPAGEDLDSVFDVKVIYSQPHGDIDLGQVPELFLPRVGPFGLIDYEKVYATDQAEDIFDLRGIDRADGCVVVVRPDQYVAAVIPLTDTAALAAHFAPIMLAQSVPQPS